MEEKKEGGLNAEFAEEARRVRREEKAPGWTRSLGETLRRTPASEGRRYNGLDAEGAAAAAGALDVGVVELEAGAFERFDVVDFHAF